MNTAKIYQDSDGDMCTIYQMIKREPEWAANRIQEGEKAFKLLEQIKKLVDDNYEPPASFLIPLSGEGDAQKYNTRCLQSINQ